MYNSRISNQICIEILYTIQFLLSNSTGLVTLDKIALILYLWIMFFNIISWITASRRWKIDIHKIMFESSEYWTNDFFPISLTSKSDIKIFKIEPTEINREPGLMRVSIDDNNNIVHNETVILKSLNSVSITDYIKEMRKKEDQKHLTHQILEYLKNVQEKYYMSSQ